MFYSKYCPLTTIRFSYLSDNSGILLQKTATLLRNPCHVHAFVHFSEKRSVVHKESVPLTKINSNQLEPILTDKPHAKVFGKYDPQPFL